MLESVGGSTPEKTYSLALSAMRRLTRGRSIGIRDVCDLANDTAWRVIQKLNSERIDDLERYIWAVARRVLWEALRAERKAPQLQPLCDLPDLPESRELPPILEKYVDRFRSRMTAEKLSLLDDILFPGGRKRKEIASEHKMSESALSKAISRINESAHAYHKEFVAPLFERMSREPSEDLDEAILAVARTPQEKADYQLRLVYGWQLHALNSSRTHAARTRLLEIPRSKLTALVARCGREQDDLGFRHATRWAIAAQYMAESRPSEAAACILDGVAEASSAGAHDLAIGSATQFLYPAMFPMKENALPYPDPNPPLLEFLEPVRFALPSQTGELTYSHCQAFCESVVNVYGNRAEPGLRPIKLA